MLTPRLKLITKYVKGETVADIGTDHAFIPIELMKTGAFLKIIASDINKGPALIAEKNIKQNGLDIEVRIGAGLSVLYPKETEDIIIAGMGGKLICDILFENLEVAKASRLILQPMNGQFELRHFLLKEGFVICNEDIALEGFKVYNIIVCDKKEKALIYKTCTDLHLPSFLSNHIYYDKLKSKKIREFTKIIAGYEKSKSSDEEERYNLYQKLLMDIKERE